LQNLIKLPKNIAKDDYKTYLAFGYVVYAFINNKTILRVKNNIQKEE